MLQKKAKIVGIWHLYEKYQTQQKIVNYWICQVKKMKADKNHKAITYLRSLPIPPLLCFQNSFATLLQA